MSKWVYLFTEGNANMRELLGGKGANLAEMTNLGLPVPQGFTITTEACTQYYEDGKQINDEIIGQIKDYMKKLEPEIKLFTFDKFERPFSELTDKEKEEELIHIRNGMNFAKKVLSTGECDLLILDEILGLSATGAVSQEELKALFDEMPDGMELILTGIENPKWLWPYVSEVTELVTDYQADET